MATDGRAMLALLAGSGEILVGTHMHPLRLFAGEGSIEPRASFDVLHEVPTVEGLAVIVTRMGGMLVRVPPELRAIEDVDAKVASGLPFQDRASAAINQVLCELALAGQVSSPASPAEMGVGRLVGSSAAITGGGGGREAYFDRTFYASMLVGDLQWYSWPRVAENILEGCVALDRARRLHSMAGLLPDLVLSAYSNLSRHQAASALATAWIVIEQLIAELWRQHVNDLPASRRRTLLRDHSYTAAVRSEILVTVGRLPTPVFDLVGPARSHRNGLMHNARGTIAEADRTADAMQAMLELVLGETVAPPIVARGIGW